jgi:hypothetical protein
MGAETLASQPPLRQPVERDGEAKLEHAALPPQPVEHDREAELDRAALPWATEQNHAPLDASIHVAGNEHSDDATLRDAHDNPAAVPTSADSHRDAVAHDHPTSLELEVVLMAEVYEYEHGLRDGIAGETGQGGAARATRQRDRIAAARTQALSFRSTPRACRHGRPQGAAPR